MAVARDQALVLRRYAYGESSLVVHACTRAHGRVHLIAKGAYRPTSRYFAVLDLFDDLELEWDHNPRRELAILRSGSITRRRRALTEDLERYRAGLTMLELADLAFRPEQGEPEQFELLRRALEELERGSARADATLVVFELAFLQNLGLAPALERCAACAGPAAPVSADPARVAFSAGAGGRLCRSCANEARAAGRRVGTLPLEVVEAGRKILADGFQHGDGTDPTPEARAQLDRVRDFVERFLDYHLESRPRTQRRFLAAPNRNAPQARRERR